MKIDTNITFEAERSRHLKNLEAIRNFILGDENNQPQVTYIPKMIDFIKFHDEIKDWVETAYFDDDSED